MKNNKKVSMRVFYIFVKFFVFTFLTLLFIIVFIPSLLSLVKGQDMDIVDDAKMRLEAVNIPEEENLFYDLNYDIEKLQSLINKENISKDLASSYLESDSWDEEVVGQILLDNEEVLEDWTLAAAKGKFQLPYTNGQAKVSADMPVTPFNIYREAGYLSGIRAIWLAKNGKYQEALDEALKNIIIGSAISKSQVTLIGYMSGVSIKDNGLDVMQKVISFIPQDFEIPLKYQLELTEYQAEKNSSPFIIEYLVWKQGLDRSLFLSNPYYLTDLERLLVKNRFYYKENLTASYYFDFFNKLVIESQKDCGDLSYVKWPVISLERNNLLKMYFTENLIGKYFTTFPEEAFNNALEKKCLTEDKLQEIILLINNKK